MPDRDPTHIGTVRHVLGSTVTVALDDDLAGTAPIYRGRLQTIGQIGSLVRIPQGVVDIIASVDLVGIAELSGPTRPVENIQHDERWLQVQLLGEIDLGTGRFQRGVGSYPGLDDSVHFATAEQLHAVFPAADSDIFVWGAWRLRRRFQYVSTHQSLLFDMLPLSDLQGQARQAWLHHYCRAL